MSNPASLLSHGPSVRAVLPNDGHDLELGMQPLSNAAAVCAAPQRGVASSEAGAASDLRDGAWNVCSRRRKASSLNVIEKATTSVEGGVSRLQRQLYTASFSLADKIINPDRSDRAFAQQEEQQ